MTFLRFSQCFVALAVLSGCVRIPVVEVDVPSGDAAMDAFDAPTPPPSDQPNPSEDRDVAAAQDDGVVSRTDADADVPVMDVPTCAMGQSMCGAMCADLQSNSMHCGMCGNLCPATQVCESGECRCPGATVVCGGACVDTTSNAANCGRCGNACPVGVGCMGGLCQCPMNATICAGTCVDIQSNTTHCGMCGNACPAGQLCNAGVCGCAAPTTACGASCVNLQSSNNNCGACGNRCPAGTSCNGGSCVCPGMGATYCPGSMSCSALALDPMNCGACGNVCSPAQTCVGGMCQCPVGNPTLCGAQCVNTQSSNSHCGACNNACPAAQTCVNSSCACPGAIPNLCGAACVNRQTDRNNCGACGTVCRADQNCVNGGCACSAGQTDCNGVCVNLQTNAANCGACARACGMGQSCSAAVCACPGGQTACGMTCVNTVTDSNNCGACGTVCNMTQVCAASACRCPVNTADCAGNQTCVDIASNPMRCGGCNNVCPIRANSSAVCANSSCGIVCDPGFANCDGSDANGCEVNLNTDNLNCGSCGAQCAAGACVAGGCQDWARRVGHNVASDRGHIVAEDSSHNLYVVMSVGGTLNLGGNNFSTNGSAGVLASYSPTGQLRWSRVFDAAGGDELTALTVGTVGGNTRVVVAGALSDRVDWGMGLVGPGGLGGFIAAYDGMGAPLWAVPTRAGAGGTAPQHNSLAMGPAGEIYLAGAFSSSLTVGAQTINGNFTTTGFLLKLNAMGAYQWGRAFGVASYVTIANAVTTDDFGDVYVTGRSGSVVNFGGGDRGTLNNGDDVFVAKYDSTNGPIWSGMFGNASLQEGEAIVVDPVTRAVTVGGHWAGALNFGGGGLTLNNASRDLFLVTFTPGGAGGLPAHVRSVSYPCGGPAASTLNRLSMTFTTDAGNPRLYLADTISGAINFGGFAVGQGGNRTLLARIDPSNLTVLAAMHFASMGTVYSQSVCSCGATSVCLTGHAAPSITFGTTTLNMPAGNNYDAYIARVTRN